MRTNLIAVAAIGAGLMAAPQAAQAALGVTTNDLNLRSCASVRCAKVAVMPRGARVQISGQQGNWYHVSWGNASGWASASYISANAGPPPRARNHRGPRPGWGNRPPRPTWGYDRRPWWDDRHNAWFDGRRWFYNGGWHHRQPNGFYFGFNFN